MEVKRNKVRWFSRWGTINQSGELETNCEEARLPLFAVFLSFGQTWEVGDGQDIRSYLPHLPFLFLLCVCLVLRCLSNKRRENRKEGRKRGKEKDVRTTAGTNGERNRSLSVSALLADRNAIVRVATYETDSSFLRGKFLCEQKALP